MPSTGATAHGGFAEMATTGSLLALGEGASASPFAPHFTIRYVNRERGLAPGESMSDIGGHLARDVDHDLREPGALHGVGAGGSVALQLAVDRPDLVSRLVVVASACRLGPGGRALQAEMARLIRSGRTRQALSHLVSCLQPPRLRGVLRPVSWLAGRWMTPHDPSDLRAISAPTLVIGGSEDVLYGRQLFERTAAGVQDGRLHVFEGWARGRTSASSATARLALTFLREERS